MKILICLFIFSISSLNAAISDQQKMAYGLKLHEAFILQSLGQSTKAFFTFQSGYMEASQAGENPRRLAAITSQFLWYRKYGSYTKLFAIEPKGNDVIQGQYQRNRAEDDARGNDFWGSHFPAFHINPSMPRLDNKTPLLAEIPRYESYNDYEMAEHRRNYIFAVGEIIVGLLLIRSGHFTTGGWLIWEGIDRAWNVVNPLLSRRDEIVKKELQKSLNEIKQVAP